MNLVSIKQTWSFTFKLQKYLKVSIILLFHRSTQWNLFEKDHKIIHIKLKYSINLLLTRT